MSTSLGMLEKKAHSLRSCSFFRGEKAVCAYSIYRSTDKISDWWTPGELNVSWPCLLGGSITVLKCCIGSNSLCTPPFQAPVYPQVGRAWPPKHCPHPLVIRLKGAVVRPACPLLALTSIFAWEWVNSSLGARSSSSGGAIGSVILATETGCAFNPALPVILNFILGT